MCPALPWSSHREVTRPLFTQLFVPRIYHQETTHTMPPFSNNMKQHHTGNLPSAMKCISEDETLSSIDLTTRSVSSAARRPASNLLDSAMSNNWRSMVAATEEDADPDAPRAVMSYHTKRAMMLEQGYTEQEIAQAMKRSTGKKTTSTATWKKSIHQRVKGVLLKIR